MGTRGREGVPNYGVVSQSWDFNVCLEGQEAWLYWAVPITTRGLLPAAQPAAYISSGADKVQPFPGRESGFSEATGNSVY